MAIVKSFFTNPQGSTCEVLTVLPKAAEFDQEGRKVWRDFRDAGIRGVEGFCAGKMYFLEGFSAEQVAKIGARLFAEDLHVVMYQGAAGEGELGRFEDFICVAYKPQLTNPELESIKWAIEALGIGCGEGKYIQTAAIYLFNSRLSSSDREHAERLLINPSIQLRVDHKPQSLEFSFGENDQVEEVRITSLSDDELLAVSDKRRLFLNLEEMKIIQAYFQELKREPTDCELEIMAQTWSQHCCHKTFKARVLIDGREKPSFFRRIKQVTEGISHPDVISSFVDNSGVVRFDDELGVCIKAETHNAPSAIEPFGGAETGVGGVIRDILGTGLGARPIAVTDALCFAEPDLPSPEIPRGCLSPAKLLSEVTAGIASYGNKVGLPNIGGALVFDRSYRAKPVVLAGSIGLIPIHKAQKGRPAPGDVIICLGGKTGKDGIHGATFSSGSMTDKTKEIDSTAVQIGYPVLKRKIIDVLAELGQQNIIHAITDCGAGGLSSAVLEIGEGLGVEVDLRKVALKYQGLKPWEIFLSESQERMVLAVSTADSGAVLDLCRRYSINVDILGRFGNGDNHARIRYGKKKVADLDLGFVFEHVVQSTIQGQSPRKFTWERAVIPALSGQELRCAARSVLNDLNVCSRECLVRRYDHVVTGCSISPYYAGVHRDAPQDALVLKPRYDSDRGLLIGTGIAPELSQQDPYLGAATAVIEAIANSIARGADPAKLFLLDNFIHPTPDNQEDVGTLDCSVDGLVDAAKAFGAPFVSGKDSLGGTYCNAEDGSLIKIAPTVIISCCAVLEDVHRTVPGYFQETGSRIVLAGDSAEELGASTLLRKLGISSDELPKCDFQATREVFAVVHRLIRDKKVLSCHDIKDGGLFAALVEMMLGNNLGVRIELGEKTVEQAVRFLFSEQVGRFVVEIPAGVDPKTLLAGMPWVELGVVRAESRMNVEWAAGGGIAFDLGELREAFHNQALENVLSLDAEKEGSVIAGRGLTSPLKAKPGNPPAVLVLKAPGTNSERETAEAFQRAGARSRIVNLFDANAADFKESQMLAIPGGFAYGDDIYAGKVFAVELLEKFGSMLREFVAQDKLVIGICNGFQVLVRAGLLPVADLGTMGAALLNNIGGSFICRYVRLKVEQGSVCRWTESLQGEILNIPIAHGEGRFYTTPEAMAAIESNHQVAFRYVDCEGKSATERPHNPNGSLNSIAGITDVTGRILGLMPHPERDPLNFCDAPPGRVIGLDVIRGGESIHNA